MINYVKKWISRQLSLGEFTSRRSVIRKSLIMAVRIAILAYGMNVAAHLLLYATDLLPYGLLPALVLATALTPAVSLTVAFVAYYVVGMAVYELSIQRTEFERLSRTDSLTGLYNRHAFMQAYERCRGSASLALFDIDRFKSVNDSYGHAIGDDVIVVMAEELTRVFQGQFVARFGGEEFVALMTGLTSQECRLLVENAREAVAARAVDVGSGEINVTISAGIAEGRDHGEFRSLFAAADKALYLAKASGRNRVVHHREISDLGPVADTSRAAV